MAFKRFSVLAVIVLLWFAPSQGQLGFNGKRSGFVMGVAVGPSMVFHHRDTEAYGELVAGGVVENSVSFSPHLFVGVGLSNEIEILASFTSNYFSSINSDSDKVVISDRLLGFEARYFVVTSDAEEDCDFDNMGAYIGRTWRRAPYLLAGAGISSWGTPVERGGAEMKGVGAYVGLGYEFMKHVSIQATYLLSSSFKKENVSVNGAVLPGTIYTRSHILGLYLSVEAF